MTAVHPGTGLKQSLPLFGAPPRPAEIAAAPGRVPGLDGLRALSILIVMMGHAYLPNAGGVAALGVYVFFCISGFLITRLMYLELKQHGHVGITKFYLRRILRLYPVLLVYLAAMIVLNWATGVGIGLTEIFGVLFYFINYLVSYATVHGTPIYLQIGVLWSLSIEEHFYLIAPLVFIAVRGRIRPMLWFTAALIVTPLLIRIAYVEIWPDIVGKLVTYYHSETRFDSIAVGVLLAALCETSGRQRLITWLAPPAAVAAGLALIVVGQGIPNPVFKETLKFTFISLGCVPLIAAVVFGTRVRLLATVANLPPLVWIGKLSYSLYVWHGCMAFIYESTGLSMPFFLASTLKLVGAFIAAIISYYVIEMPLVGLRSRIK